MNENELEARLRATLRERASSVAERPDAWNGYSERSPIASTPHPTAGRRLVWLGVAAAAALIVFVVLQVTSSPSVKVTAVAPETTDTGVSAAPSTSVGSTTIPAPTTVPSPVPGPVGLPVPALFTSSSVTFVSLHTGWVLGTAPCGLTHCMELLRTRDGGQTWVALPQPPMPVADSSNVQQRHVRFANLNDGWIYGPDLWVTHDGGATWNRAPGEGLSPDTPVTALETDGEVVYAVVEPSTVITSPVDHDDWRAAPVSIPIGAGPVPFAQLVVQGAGGWIIENNRTVVGGARLEDGKWTEWQPPCIDKAGPAVLTASTPTDVVVVCHEGVWGNGPPTENVLVSSDGGTTFHEIPAPLTGDWQVDGVASAGSDTIVVAGVANGSRVLEATFDGGDSWTALHSEPAGGSWTDIGFTGPTQGIAIAHLEDGGELLMTTDGGHTWTPADFYAGR
ncbi:MAG: YCF48-related protein [Acidimicrobiales bacterium]